MYVFQHGIIASSNGGATPNPLWDGLVAYYTADNTPNDALGTYNGTLTNGATYATGKINNGFSLDGVNDFVSISPIMGGTVSGPTSPHTYSAWIYPTNVTDQYNFIFQNGDTTRGSSIALNTNKICYFYKGGSYVLASTATLTVNTWNHVLITYDGGGLNNSNVSFYLNGVFDKTVSTPSWGTETGSYGYTQIGKYVASSHYFNGKIDELGIWNRALTPTEVTELYNSGSGLQYS